VQTGDKTGTGAGGESFFGGAAFSLLTLTAHFFNTFRPGVRRTIEQFEDEIHPRLRFAHRGLVAMANNGAKNSNDSQFIITLGASFPIFTPSLTKLGVDRADELHGKHTLFGRCVGDTIYSGSFMLGPLSYAANRCLNSDVMKISAMGVSHMQLHRHLSEEN